MGKRNGEQGSEMIWWLTDPEERDHVYKEIV